MRGTDGDKKRHRDEREISVGGIICLINLSIVTIK